MIEDANNLNYYLILKYIVGDPRLLTAKTKLENYFGYAICTESMLAVHSSLEKILPFTKDILCKKLVDKIEISNK